MISDERLGDALRDSMPVKDDDLDTDAVAALRTVVHEIRRHGTARVWPRRVRMAIAGLVGAAVVGGFGAPALADWVELRTGEKNPSGQEMWRFNSPEAERVMISYTKDYPLAPGYTAETMVSSFPHHNAMGPDILFRQIVNGYSVCTWEITWLNAKPGSKAKAQAAEAIRLVPYRDRHPVDLYDDSTVALNKQLYNNPAMIRQDVKANCGGIRK